MTVRPCLPRARKRPFRRARSHSGVRAFSESPKHPLCGVPTKYSNWPKCRRIESATAKTAVGLSRHCAHRRDPTEHWPNHGNTGSGSRDRLLAACRRRVRYCGRSDVWPCGPGGGTRVRLFYAICSPDPRCRRSRAISGLVQMTRYGMTRRDFLAHRHIQATTRHGARAARMKPAAGGRRQRARHLA